MPTKMKTLAIAFFGGGALLAQQLPVDDLSKLGVAGGCLFLLWWTVAKTLPTVVKAQSDSLANLTDAYQRSVSQVREVHQETTSQLCLHLDKVEGAIHEAAKNEAALLRQLISESRSK